MLADFPEIGYPRRAAARPCARPAKERAESMSDFGLVYPLWTDPQAPGILLDRAVGEIGFDHLTLPVVTGPRERFRCAPADPPHTFATEGGWHFTPEAENYRGGPLRPRAARWFGKRDLLGRLCEYAGARDVALLVRVDLRAVGALVEHEPHLRTRDAWGDDVVSAGACPSNPDLRELLRATLDDLQRYAPAGFQLADWIPDLPINRHLPRPLDWHPLVRRLLDICFCTACRQAAASAGIDPDQAARSVRVHIERLLTQSRDHRDAAVSSDPVLEAYVQARLRDTAAWLGRLSEAGAVKRWSLLCDPQVHESTGPFLAESTLVPVLRTDRLSGTLDEQELSRLACAGAPPCGLALPVWRPFFDQPDQFVRVVTEVTRAGVTFFDFEGLDEAPDEAFTWLRQAVRYARRG